MPSDDRTPMHGKVWVGRVKSNCPPEFLEAAFSRIGPLVKVETGFAGFAFVDYEHEDDAEEAVKQLNKAQIANIGEVHVSRATHRGYDDACLKRDIYQRTKGRIGEVYHCGDRGSRGLVGQRHTSRSRSRGRSRGKSSGSRSRSGSRKRQRYSRSRSASFGRSRNLRRQSLSNERKLKPVARSVSKSRSKSKSRPRKSRSRSGSNKEQRKPSRSPIARAPAHSAREPSIKAHREDAVEEQQIVRHESAVQDPYAEPGEASTAGGFLSPQERGAVVQFFDGASVRELLLESSAVLAVPDLYVPEILNGFPHSFQGLSQEGVINMLAVFAGFIRGSSTDPPAADLSAEVRQTLVVNSRGQRIMRKSILVDGVTCSTEEQVL